MIMPAKDIICNSIESRKERYWEVSRAIWEYAEAGYKEFKSAALLVDELKKEGFEVTEKLAGIDTAFKGVWGKGKPVVGILGEFDSLPGLSQKAGVAEKIPLVEGGRGHGCGHNLLGTATLAAAVAIKDYLKETGTEGTVIYFGTPAEENGCGKTFMARDGVFEGVDFFYTWHPGAFNGVRPVHMNAGITKLYTFHGVAAHAASMPHVGRSALDAVEMMSVGVNYLREHVVPEVRMHYAYVNAGGTAPNVVQDFAQVRYLLRAPSVTQVRKLVERVDDVAKGAALMAGVTVESVIESGYSDYEPNTVLAVTAHEAFKELGPVSWDEEDYELARRFTATVKGQDDNLIRILSEKFGEDQVPNKLANPLDTSIPEFDLYHKKNTPASTDVGDAGKFAPAVMMGIAVEAFGTPVHSWQRTAQACSALGNKGLLKAAQVMAYASVKMIENPELLEAAKKEFQSKNHGYLCPIEKDTVLPGDL